ncbi:MAG: lysozyme, partial [Anaerovoracaceae bacterium]
RVPQYLPNTKSKSVTLRESEAIPSPSFYNYIKGITMAMQLSNNGFKILGELEGIILKPYKDSVGIPTIGIGSTYYEDGTKVKMTDKAITKERAIELAKNVVKSFEAQVNKSIVTPATQNQFDAMVLLCYNIGVSGFARSSVVKYFNAGNFQKAADSFLLWNKAGGKALKGLTNRRNIERSLFLTK